MTELKCKNCGASLHGDKYEHFVKCEYCGSEYEMHNEFGKVYYIETCRAKVECLGCQIRVDDEMLLHMPPDEVSNYAIKRLTRSLAEELAQYMKIETERDPMTMTQIIRGTIRVVKPDFRF